jgi:hypothetical protein
LLENQLQQQVQPGVLIWQEKLAGQAHLLLPLLLLRLLRQLSPLVPL